MTETQENKMERDYIDVGLVQAINYLAKDMGYSREPGERSDILERLFSFYQKLFLAKVEREIDVNMKQKDEWGSRHYYETHK